MMAGLGNFRLRGSGGFADVYDADEVDLGRRVAVKLFRTRVGGDERRSFEREAHALGRLSGIRNVVQVYQSGVTDDDHPYFVMELMDGSLADVLADGPVAVADACHAGVLLGRALMAAHREGIVHRDIKPGNILIDRYGEPALSDFGISGLADAGTSSFIYAFSAEHAAPEVFDRMGPTPVADIYSLASTLYASMEGHPPFEREEGEGALTFMRRVQESPCPPCAAAVAIDPALDVVLRSALVKDPDERPSLAAFVDGLAGYANLNESRPGGGALSVPPRSGAVLPSSGTPTGPPAEVMTPDGGPEARRLRSARRTRAGVAAVMAAALVGVGTAAWAPMRENGEEADNLEKVAATGEESASVTDVTLRPDGVTNSEPVEVPGTADTSGVLRSNIESFAATTSAAPVLADATRQDYDAVKLRFGKPPVRLDYAATNAQTTTRCLAVYAKDLVVEGATGSFWLHEQFVVGLNAVQFDTEVHAKQYFWATSMYFGLANDDCEGWPEGRTAVDPEDLRIDRRDFELVAPTTDLVTVIDDDQQLGGIDGAILYQVVTRVDDRVITASVTSVSEGLDPSIAITILNEAIAAFPVA